MPPRKTVSDIIDLDVDSKPADSPPDPERAADALSGIDEASQQPERDKSEPPTERPRPVRRTKAELQRDVERLESELRAKNAQAEQQKPIDAAKIVESMKIPLAMTFGAMGRVVAAFRGPHWEFKEEECKALGEAWAPVVAPMINDNPEVIMWSAAIAVTAQVAMPRLAEDAKNKRLAAEKKDEPSTAEVVE